MDGIDILGVCMIMIMSFVGGCSFGSNQVNNYWKNEMLDKGVGEYYLDENNNKQFRILECSNE